MEITDVLDAIKALGIAGGPVFAFLWWLERNERMTLQASVTAMLEKVLTNIAASTTAITEVTKAVIESSDAGRDTNGLIAQLSQLIRSLGQGLRRKGA